MPRNTNPIEPRPSPARKGGDAAHAAKHAVPVRFRRFAPSPAFPPGLERLAFPPGLERLAFPPGLERPAFPPGLERLAFPPGLNDNQMR
jgi:hypothetical protein